MSASLNLRKHYLPQLSGGQRRRIDLARGLAFERRVLLLDEPFGALYAKVRKELRHWLGRLRGELHVTSIFVSYGQEKTLEVTDQIVVINHGRVEQVGVLSEVRQYPATPFVYRFSGNINLFHGRVHKGVYDADGVVFGASSHADTKDAVSTVNVRPHELEIEC